MCPKKIKETDAIFEQLAQTHAQAREDNTVLRLSLDAKAAVNIGPFSRHGKTRVHLCAADHDFQPEEILTPCGIFLPQHDETYLFFTPSKVTADFIVDCLRTFWLSVRKSFPLVKTLLLNLDNGPENHSRRTQFMARLVALSDAFGLTSSWPTTRLITANTIPLSAYGVSWSSTGMAIYSIHVKRFCVWPRPCLITASLLLSASSRPSITQVSVYLPRP